MRADLAKASLDLHAISRLWDRFFGLTRESLPNVLFVVHRFPHPPDKGDRIRAFHLLEHLARKCRLHVACLAHEPFAADSLAALDDLCAGLEVIPHGRFGKLARAARSLASGRTATEGAFQSPELRNVLLDWSRSIRFDACLASASSVAPYLRLEPLRRTPAVVDLVDVDSRKWLDYGAASRGPSAWLYRLEGSRLARLEAEILRWAHAVTLVSEAEAGLLRSVSAEGDVRAIPNGVDLDYFRAIDARVDPESCVFVGQLDYKPNVDGASWFCREVWPRLRSRRPGAEVRLVGRRPIAAVERLGELPGVKLVGEVPDVRPHVASAAVVIAPLRIARGIQNKVLEALAMDKAVVGTPYAAEGLAAEPGKDLLVASKIDEWVDAIDRLFDDADLRKRLGAGGREYVERAHHWDRCLEPFGALLDLESASVR